MSQNLYIGLKLFWHFLNIAFRVFCKVKKKYCRFQSDKFSFEDDYA